MKKERTYPTPAKMDEVIKYMLGPRKMSSTEAGEITGLAPATCVRITNVYKRAAVDDTEEMAEYLTKNTVGPKTIAWAYECYGKEVPPDLAARVQAKKRGDLFEEKPAEKPEEKPKEKPKQDTNAENLIVLCDRINAIGKALSDCLTEETAGKLAGRLVDAIGALVKESSANADNILAEMQKQTELLQKIVYNTKKLNKGGQL